MSTAMPLHPSQPTYPFNNPFAAPTRPSRKRHASDDGDVAREQPLSKRLSRLSIAQQQQRAHEASSFGRPSYYTPQPQQQPQQQWYTPQPQPSFNQQSYFPQQPFTTAQQQPNPSYPASPTLHPQTPPAGDTDMDMDLSDLSSPPSPTSTASSDSESEAPFMMPKHIKKTLNRLPYHLFRSQTNSSPSMEFPVTGQELVLYRPVDPARNEKEELKRRFLEARERERRERALAETDRRMFEGMGGAGDMGGRIVELDEEGNELGGWDEDAMDVE
ncbi:hypothetical protein BJ508DRAFT_326470 [Ascobolus immersus RN42]|uniref:Uncharacterized protein n=1 Tax=Ascobolus immersus RN42 TaxID=1160509 RepID=A0A3N4I5H9_ASCIM|nr:hypothetical protein BJ508DRAFT_326470 [Ascobolus immersus RN42]